MHFRLLVFCTILLLLVEASTKDVKIYRNGTSLTITNYQASASALGDNSGVYAMGGFVGGTDTWDGVLDEFGFGTGNLAVQKRLIFIIQVQCCHMMI